MRLSKIEEQASVAGAETVRRSRCRESPRRWWAAGADVRGLVGQVKDLDSISTLRTPLRTAAAAAAKSLQSCPTLCDPIDGSPPSSLSLGFSRQEHWSGLPFPSPMHESEK